PDGVRQSSQISDIVAAEIALDNQTPDIELDAVARTGRSLAKSRAAPRRRIGDDANRTRRESFSEQREETARLSRLLNSLYLTQHH
ncbi:hypothetical protein J6590_095940, partial [Homalodisca vitripennis]